MSVDQDTKLFTKILRGDGEGKDKETLMNDLLYIVQCMKLGFETITPHSMTSGVAWVIQESRRNLIVVLRYPNENKSLKDNAGNDKGVDFDATVQECRTTNSRAPEECKNEDDSISVADLEPILDSATEECAFDASAPSFSSMHGTKLPDSSFNIAEDGSRLLNQPDTEQRTSMSEDALNPSPPILVKRIKLEIAETCVDVKEENIVSFALSEHSYCDTSYIEEDDDDHPHDDPLDAQDDSSQSSLIDSKNSLSLQPENTQESICADAVEHDNQSNEQCISVAQPCLEPTVSVQKVIVKTIEIPKMLRSLMLQPQNNERSNHNRPIGNTEQRDPTVQLNGTPACASNLSSSSIRKECNKVPCVNASAVGTNGSVTCKEMPPTVSEDRKLCSASSLMRKIVQVIGDKAISASNKDALAIMSQNPKAIATDRVVKLPTAASSSTLDPTNDGKKIACALKPGSCVVPTFGTETALVVQNECSSVTENLAQNSVDVSVKFYADRKDCRRSTSNVAQNFEKLSASGKMLIHAGILREHRQIVHPIVENSREIHFEDECLQRQYLKRKQMVGAGEKPCFECDCKKTFSQFANLKRHRLYRCKLRKDRIALEKPHQCSECGKMFTYSHQLKLHNRIHTGEKPFECKFCGKLFTSRTNINRHVRGHTGEKPYSCSDCLKTFMHSTSLKIHRLRRHSGERSFQCSQCDKKFFTRSDLKSHERGHTGVKPYQCSLCDKKYSQIQNLKRHHRTHTGEKPYECVECNRKFMFAEDLKKHSFHHTEDEPYQCAQCGKEFSSLELLTNHERLHSGIRHCSYCDKKFTCTNSSFMNAHRKKCRTQHKESFLCSECGKTFSSSSSLKIHQNRHTQRDKTHMCSQCGKGFLTKDSLKQHEGRHAGIKPYQCSHCKMTFYTEKTLENHAVVHTGKQPYKCNHCDRKFFRKDSLKVHQRVHTGEKRYKCSYCEMDFLLRYHMKKHETEEHTGERPYECRHCNKRFIVLGLLTKHEKIHLAVKPHQCLYCDKSFTRAYRLAEHQKLHEIKGDLRCFECKKEFKTLKSLKKHQEKKHNK